MSKVDAFKIMTVIAVVVGFLWPFSAGAVDTIAPDGPFQVGVRLESVELLGREAPVIVWYPARPGPDAPRNDYSVGITGYAAYRAEPDRDAGPYPLILFSHGMGGCALQHVFINENLASFGYVVIAPDHQESLMCHSDGSPPEMGETRLALSVLGNWFDLSKVVFDLFGDMLEEREYDFSFRPAEVKAVIDWALSRNQCSGSWLSGMIDDERIGMSGHSLGGYTTLMVGGMPYFCDDEPPPASQCSFDDLALDRLPNPCCLEYVRDLEPFEYSDPRVKAIFVMSPAIMFPDLARAARSLDVPIMIVNGGFERFEVPWAPIQTIYDNASPPKYLVLLKGVDHMTAADSTLAIPIARPFLPGFRWGFEQKAQAYKELSVAFFDLYLKKEDESADVLEEPLNSYVRIWSAP